MNEGSYTPDLKAYPTTVAELVGYREKTYPETDFLLGYYAGELKTIGTGDFARRVRAVNVHLRQLGVEKGDRVALLSPSKPGWGICYCGVVLNGAVVVPIDHLLTPSEYGHILRAGKVEVLIADGGCYLDVRENLDHYPDLRYIINLDEWELLDPAKSVPDPGDPPTRREVGRINDQLAGYKRIKDFQIRDEDLPKTSTKKVKRHLLEGE